jgi:hypothetical protein
MTSVKDMPQPKKPPDQDAGSRAHAPTWPARVSIGLNVANGILLFLVFTLRGGALIGPTATVLLFGPVVFVVSAVLFFYALVKGLPSEEGGFALSVWAGVTLVASSPVFFAGIMVLPARLAG